MILNWIQSLLDCHLRPEPEMALDQISFDNFIDIFIA